MQDAEEIGDGEGSMRKTQIRPTGTKLSRRNLLQLGLAGSATLAMPAIVQAQGTQRYVNRLSKG